MADSDKGKMTVAEAGKKGGDKTRDTHGSEHYERIGRLGGQKMRRLLEKGKALEREES